jgi:hypothetical protein
MWLDTWVNHGHLILKQLGSKPLDSKSLSLDDHTIFLIRDHNGLFFNAEIAQLDKKTGDVLVNLMYNPTNPEDHRYWVNDKEQLGLDQNHYKLSDIPQYFKKSVHLIPHGYQELKTAKDFQPYSLINEYPFGQGNLNLYNLYFDPDSLDTSRMSSKMLKLFQGLRTPLMTLPSASASTSTSTSKYISTMTSGHQTPWKWTQSSCWIDNLLFAMFGTSPPIRLFHDKILNAPSSASNKKIQISLKKDILNLHDNKFTTCRHLRTSLKLSSDDTRDPYDELYLILINAFNLNHEIIHQTRGHDVILPISLTESSSKVNKLHLSDLIMNSLSGSTLLPSTDLLPIKIQRLYHTYNLKTHQLQAEYYKFTPVIIPEEFTIDNITWELMSAVIRLEDQEHFNSVVRLQVDSKVGIVVDPKVVWAYYHNQPSAVKGNDIDIYPSFQALINSPNGKLLQSGAYLLFYQQKNRSRIQYGGHTKETSLGSVTIPTMSFTYNNKTYATVDEFIQDYGSSNLKSQLSVQLLGRLLQIQAHPSLVADVAIKAQTDPTWKLIQNTYLTGSENDIKTFQ